MIGSRLSATLALLNLYGDCLNDSCQGTKNIVPRLAFMQLYAIYIFLSGWLSSLFHCAIFIAHCVNHPSHSIPPCFQRLSSALSITTNFLFGNMEISGGGFPGRASFAHLAK
jgi:hypothetical protein